MKKSILIFAMLSIFTVSFAQKQQSEKIGVYKFHPLGLITSSFVFGREIFNVEKTRSTVITLGIRYRNNESQIPSYDGNMPSIDQFSKWTGGSINVERRFYVPSFGSKTGTMVDNRGTWGIYLAPALKVDYNKNSYDRSYYNSLFDSKTNKSTSVKVSNIGNGEYIGITPTANIGLQFTIFQNMYIDLFVGGGLRILNKKQEKGANPPQYYSGENGAIETFIIKEGVVPNGGINIGIRL